MYIITGIDKLEIFSGRYLGSFWNWVRLLSLALVYAALGVYVWRSLLTKAAVEEVIENAGASTCHCCCTLFGKSLYK